MKTYWMRSRIENLLTKYNIPQEKFRLSSSRLTSGCSHLTYSALSVMDIGLAKLIVTRVRYFPITLCLLGKVQSSIPEQISFIAWQSAYGGLSLYERDILFYMHFA